MEYNKHKCVDCQHYVKICSGWCLYRGAVLAWQVSDNGDCSHWQMKPWYKLNLKSLFRLACKGHLDYRGEK